MDLSPALQTLKNEANELRTQIKGIAAHTKDLKDAVVASEAFPPNARQAEEGEPDKGETISNVMLAYRHLEDASMRLGKAIQAIDGGRSVYDRATTVGA